MTTCAAVCIVAIVAGQIGRCSCTPNCTCGCQSGKLCECLHDGKPLPLPAPKEPAKEKPAEETGKKKPMQNFGVDFSKIGPLQRYLLGPKEEEITKGEAIERIENGQIPDDAKKVRLTVIGSVEERKRVLADLDGPLKAARSHCVVQAYPPDSPILEGLGFVTTGHPTIYLQLPDGTVLHRQDDYDGPARLLVALRKSDPNYNPDLDPDLSKPKPKPEPTPPTGPTPTLPDVSKVPMPVWLILAAALYLLFGMPTTAPSSTPTP